MIGWDDCDGKPCDNPRCSKQAELRVNTGATPLNPSRDVWVCDQHAEKLFDSVKTYAGQERIAIQLLAREEQRARENNRH